jgi:hypothetical protein
MSRWYSYCDGGQKGHRSLNSGYCVVRALAIVEDIEWTEAEDAVRHFAKLGKTGGTISRGVKRADIDKVYAHYGWHWQKVDKVTIPDLAAVYQPRPANLRDKGTVIARQAGHVCAVVDGIVLDIFDCKRKMVYGYWAKAH